MPGFRKNLKEKLSLSSPKGNGHNTASNVEFDYDINTLTPTKLFFDPAPQECNYRFHWKCEPNRTHPEPVENLLNLGKCFYGQRWETPHLPPFFKMVQHMSECRKDRPKAVTNWLKGNAVEYERMARGRVFMAKYPPPGATSDVVNTGKLIKSP
jgi:hypothetical protein